LTQMIEVLIIHSRATNTSCAPEDFLFFLPVLSHELGLLLIHLLLDILVDLDEILLAPFMLVGLEALVHQFLEDPCLQVHP